MTLSARPSLPLNRNFRTPGESTVKDFQLITARLAPGAMVTVVVLPDDAAAAFTAEVASDALIAAARLDDRRMSAMLERAVQHSNRPRRREMPLRSPEEFMKRTPFPATN